MPMIVEIALARNVQPIALPQPMASRLRAHHASIATTGRNINQVGGQ